MYPKENFQTEDDRWGRSLHLFIPYGFSQFKLSISVHIGLLRPVLLLFQANISIYSMCQNYLSPYKPPILCTRVHVLMV